MLFRSLEDFQKRLAEISDEEVYMMLEQGEAYANEVANRKLREVQEAFGLR